MAGRVFLGKNILRPNMERNAERRKKRLRETSLAVESLGEGVFVSGQCKQRKPMRPQRIEGFGCCERLPEYPSKQPNRLGRARL